ncbi:hypothetical protein [Curtobacterium sp. DN_7.5]|uniref:hypothetical protein n=1 Tax=Curtobacterium sp. DN_7.5 TaxID=3049047 RepID=UPI001F55EDDD|nr:hypothetical protein [Curtobacterium sp. DN_7.5]
MSKPRNPRYFPTMKVRGARRRRIAPYQRATGSFERLAAAFATLVDEAITTSLAVRQLDRTTSTATAEEDAA